MKRPTPPHDRRILCTSCGGLLVVDSGAKSVNCKHCHKRVICEPVTVKDYMAVRRLRTASTIRITKKGNVLASLWCEDLLIEGRFKGDAIALGGMKLTRRAQVQGDLRATTLTIAEGAVLTGVMRIGPEYIPQHEAMVPAPPPDEGIRLASDDSAPREPRPS